MRTRGLSIVALMVALAGSAHIVRADDPDAGALQGPKVSTPAASKPTLVKKDFDGKLELLDTRPEQAALAHLKLSEEEQAATQKILTDRLGKVTTFVFEHQDLFNALQAGRQGGASRQELAPKMRELAEAGKDFIDPPLLTQLSEKLSTDNAAELRRLVAEYAGALAEYNQSQRGANAGSGDEANARRAERRRRAEQRQEPMADKPMTGEKAAEVTPDYTIPRRLEITLLLREMGRALSGVVTERREATEELFKAINATDEQKSKIEAIIREGRTGTGKPPTPEQRAENARKIMELLTPEQRELMRKYRQSQR